jgi:hypothetical protein
VLLPCTCVLQPTLVYYQTSSLLPSPLPIVVLASLSLLYLFLYSEHINHIQVFGFLPFPYPSHAQSNITAFVLGLYLHMRENMWFLTFWASLALLKM